MADMTLKLNLRQYARLLEALFARRTPILSESGPGLGKTAVTKQVAQSLALKINKPVGYYPLVMTNHDPIDVTGFNVPQRSANELTSKLTTPFFWDDIKTWDGVNKFGFLHWDEVSDAELPGQKIVARAIYDRVVGTHKLPDGVINLLSGNRKKDKSGVTRRATMFQNRLLEVQLDYNSDILLDHLITESFNPLALAFIKTHPGIIYNDTVPTDPGPFCSPRSFEEGVKDLVALAEDFQLPAMSLMPKAKAAVFAEYYTLANGVMSGRVGAGVSAQFFTHMKYADQLPTMDEIVLDPVKAKLPDNLGGEYMVSYMIAQSAKDKQLPAVIEYFKRMKTEMQIVTMKGLIDRQQKNGELPTLLAQPGVSAWAVKHKDVVMLSA